MKKAIISVLIMSMLVLLTLSAYGTSSGRTPLAQEASQEASQETAQYKITFTSIWSNETHPWPNFPAGAHFSRLVGATHNQSVTFWERGGIATDGIENMAESGNNTNLKAEVDAAILAGTTEQYLAGSGLGSATGTIILDSVDVQQDYPLVTLVTMIAPSPDWFVGVSAVSLRENGEWVSSKEITLFPYDAGTDDGVDYGSPNADTVPAEPMVSISGEAPFSDQPIGTLTFTRINVPDPTTCPQATPEPFVVDYISPTELTTQTLGVRIGNGDAVTVTAPSGVYTATGDFSFATPAQVQVDLLPDQKNDLAVAAHVRPVTQGDCSYGNYTLTTNVSVQQQTSPIFRIFAPVIQLFQ